MTTSVVLLSLLLLMVVMVGQVVIAANRGVDGVNVPDTPVGGQEKQLDQHSAQQDQMCELKVTMTLGMCDVDQVEQQRPGPAGSHGQNSVPEGTMCMLDPSQGDTLVMICEHGEWEQTRDFTVHLGTMAPSRQKRFFTELLTMIAGAFVSEIVTRLVNFICSLIPGCNADSAGGYPPPPPPPPNDPPKFTKCPGPTISITTEKGKDTAELTWTEPEASDKEDGKPQIYEAEGPKRNSEQKKGEYTIIYMAKDSQGKIALCQFKVEVKVRSCNDDHTFLAYGKADCYPASKKNIYGSSCTYTCNDGYTLAGNKDASCMENGNWDVRKPVCKEISCGEPAAIEKGKVQCSSTKYLSKCSVLCDDGYEVKEAEKATITCQANTRWTSPGKCVDNQPPMVTCGNDTTVYAGPLNSPVQVQFELPDVSDNSGANLAAACDSSTFGLGLNKVTCTAIDEANNVGECSFMVQVIAKTCPRLEAPEHAGIECSYENVYGSECTSTCRQAYELEGEAIRTCLENETWSGSLQQCNRRSCSAPPTISDGHYNCPSGIKYEDSCSLVCDAGFQPVAPFTITCNIYVQWSQTGACIDVEPPVFPNGCPADMNVDAASLGEPTYVTYPLPQATDNSGETPTVTGDPISGSVFDEGVTVVTITAFDSLMNNNSCQFVVSVRNISCDEPNLDTSGKDLMDYDCPYNYVYGAECSVSCTDGNPLIGPASIKCDKNKNSGNLEWTWAGTVRPYCDPARCSKLDAPDNGAMACDSIGGTGEICFLLCNKNFTYPASASDSYTCFPSTGSWRPHDHVPGCLSRRKPNDAFTKPSFYYYSGTCNTSIDAIKRNFLQALSASNYQDVCAGPTGCNTSDVSVTCGAVTRKRRRSVDQTASSQQYRIEIVAKIILTFEDHESPIEILKVHEKVIKEINNVLKSESESGMFDVPSIGAFDTMYTGVPDYECIAGSKFVHSTVSCAGCGEGYRYNNDTQDCDICPRGSYQDQEIAYTCSPCPTGKTTKHAGATSLQQCQDACLPGQSSRSGLQPCVHCPPGTYQAQYAETSCDFCPFGMSTLASGESSEMGCQFFNKRLSESSLQPRIKASDSTPSYITVTGWIHDVSTSISSSLAFSLGQTSVQNGTAYLAVGDVALLIERTNRHKERTVRKWNHVAVTCSKEKTTLYVNGQIVSSQSSVTLTQKPALVFKPSQKLLFIDTSGLQMTESLLTDQQVQELSNSCAQRLDDNVLVVDQRDTALVTPSSCDDINDCDGDPCGQHGTCLDGNSTFSCHCDEPWSGDRCQNVPDFCIGNACSNGASCLSQPESRNYSCVCTPGYRGVLCADAVVDGNWGNWTNWSDCSVTCGKGQSSRVRECNSPRPDPEGKPCEGAGEEIMECETQPCPVDGWYGEWQSWSTDGTCGSVIRSRTRECNPPIHGGRRCVGPHRQISEPVSLEPCPVDGQWGDWADWSPCSVTCGGGVFTRTRVCNNPAPMHGGAECDSSEAVESRMCNTDPCPQCKAPQMYLGQKDWNCTVDEAADLQTCQIVCERGLAFVSDLPNSFQCGRATGYTWTHQTEDNPLGILPACSDQKVPISIIPQTTHIYKNIDCEKPPSEKDLTAAIENQTGGSLSCIKSSTCVPTIHVHSTCKTGGRKKRSTGTISLSMKLELEGFQGPRPVNIRELTDEELSKELDRLTALQELITQFENKTDEIFTITVDGVEYVGEAGPMEAAVACHTGTGIIDGVCVDCPEGSYSSGNGSCELCAKGFYQDQVRMEACEACPNGLTTPGKGSVSLDQCMQNPPSYEDQFPTYPPPPTIEKSEEEESVGGEREEPEKVDGWWTEWTLWSADVTCGQAKRMRTRECNPPLHGGQECIGPHLDLERQLLPKCPASGIWGTWAAWSDCSETCGNGQRSRFRQCTTEEEPCLGSNEETNTCESSPCPVNGWWEEWGPWTYSASCGYSVRMRTRECNPPLYGGFRCIGPHRQHRSWYMGRRCPAKRFKTIF